MQKTISINRTMDEYRRNFYRVYHSKISPIFKKFESERKFRLLLLCAICAMLLFLDVIIGFDYFSGRISSKSEMLVFIECCVGIIGLIAIIALPIYFNDKFVKDLKKSCMSELLSLFGNVSWFDGANLISDSEIKESDLFAVYNRRDAKDSFIGSFKNVDFKIAETNMRLVSGSGKHRRVVNIFQGVVVKFKSNKSIIGKTIIATRGDTKIRNSRPGMVLGCVGVLQLLPNFFSGELNMGNLIFLGVVVVLIIFIHVGINLYASKNTTKMQEIKLEDPEFRKKYKAYSSDQIEGRYLITTAFMERFKNIQTAFGTNKVKCSFYNDSLMFAISTNKNLFEIGSLWFSLDNPKQLEVFFNELTSIFMLVDYFKLDEKIGL